MFFWAFSLFNFYWIQKMSGTRMATGLCLATFSDWLMVDHLQIPDEHVSWWIAASCLAFGYSDSSRPLRPPKTNRSPLISRMECHSSLFGNGGPNVGINKKMNEKICKKSKIKMWPRLVWKRNEKENYSYKREILKV